MNLYNAISTVHDFNFQQTFYFSKKSFNKKSHMLAIKNQFWSYQKNFCVHFFNLRNLCLLMTFLADVYGFTLCNQECVRSLVHSLLPTGDRDSVKLD